VTYNNILALDAANGSLAACLTTASGTFFRDEAASLPLSQNILPCITSLMIQADMHWSALDGFALSCGPGSFTGLRVVAATVAGLNSRLELPILKLCSLYMSYLQADTEKKVWVVEDARTKSAYTACFQQQHTILAPECMSLDQLAQYDAALYVAQKAPKEGLSDWSALPLKLRRSQALAVALKKVNWHDNTEWMSYPELNYIQMSQAERMMKHAT